MATDARTVDRHEPWADIQAGQERAVAATKSHTAQLLALHLPFDRVHGGDATAGMGLSDLGEQPLGENAHVAELAQRLPQPTRGSLLSRLDTSSLMRQSR